MEANIPILKTKNNTHIHIPFMQRFGLEDKALPAFEMPKKPMNPEAAYRIIKDEMNLDGNPALNLASFVTTRMDPECDKLMVENLNKNFIDSDEYPQCSVIESRCVAMLRKIFNAPESSIKEEEQTINPSLPSSKLFGVSTVGSSEAIHLASLNMKQMWERHQPLLNGLPHPPDINAQFDECGVSRISALKSSTGTSKIPNLIFSEVAHVCQHKFCRYFGVEQRHISISEKHTILDVEKAISMCDENTIGIVAILGSTYTGEFDNVELLNEKLDKLNKEKGQNIPIHVDGASGALIASFCFPQCKWDFRLKQVKSINISGHKYGLVYPGIGQLVFRDQQSIHKGLIFEVDYLGAPELTFTLNFSKGASHVLGQYYQFLRLGQKGYKTVFNECLSIAGFIEHLMRKQENKRKEKIFKFQSNLCHKQPSLPVVVFSLNKNAVNFTEKHLVSKLRERGQILPRCELPFPKNSDENHVMNKHNSHSSSKNSGESNKNNSTYEPVYVIRIVVRETLTENLARILLQDIHSAMRSIQIDLKHDTSEFGQVPDNSNLKTMTDMADKLIMLSKFRRMSSIC